MKPTEVAAPHLQTGPQMHTQQSAALFARAKKVLAGGISSSARSTTTGSLNYPLYMQRGLGPRIWDADGNAFIDYLLSYGSVILGHADAGLIAAVSGQLQNGTMFGTCNPIEVDLAEQICRMAPGADLVRFSNSGSEAICGAIRAARGFTGRNKLLKFEGHYHGWVDVLAISNRPTTEQAGPADHPFSHPHSRGIPAGVVEDVIIAPWNDRDAVSSILAAHSEGFAAVILEPVVANNSCTMPEAGFLQWIREECSRRGIVLIFDEIVTGFRMAPGGAAEYFGVTPDMAVYSKALGGGFAISAFTGRRDIMELVGANTVKHGGTYNGNPLCAAASLHTLRRLAEPGVLQAMKAHGNLLIEAIRRSAQDCGIACVVQGAGTMFQVLFGLTSPPKNYRQVVQADAGRYGAFRQGLLDQRVHVNSAGMACWFVSAAHGPDEADATCKAIAWAMKKLK